TTAGGAGCPAPALDRAATAGSGPAAGGAELVRGAAPRVCRAARGVVAPQRGLGAGAAGAGRARPVGGALTPRVRRAVRRLGPRREADRGATACLGRPACRGGEDHRPRAPGPGGGDSATGA